MSLACGCRYHTCDTSPFHAGVPGCDILHAPFRAMYITVEQLTLVRNPEYYCTADATRVKVLEAVRTK